MQRSDTRSMTSSEVVYRLATTADAARLSEFAERTFRETFSPTNRAADMEIYCASAFGCDIQLRELADPMVTTILGEVDEDLVAYAQLYDVTPDPAVVGARPVELRRFYLTRHLHGTRVAADLMDRVAVHARRNGHDVVWLGVWENNPRAIRFYQKRGFRTVGDHVFLMGTDRQRDLIMSLALHG